MTEDIQNEAVHIKADDILPANSPASVEAEMLKKILQQIVENERKRIRNEFIRISLFALIVLLFLLGGVLWLSRNVLWELRAERQSTERAWNKLTQSLPGYDGTVSRGTRIADNFKEKKASQTAVTRDKNAKSFLMKLITKIKSRKQQMQYPKGEKPTKVANAESPETARPASSSSKRPDILKDQYPGPQAAGEPTPGPAGKKRYPTSLTTRVRGDIPLRVPIPKP